MDSAAATKASLQKSSRGAIIVDPRWSLKSQTTFKPLFAIALASHKGSSFQKIIKNHTEQELVTTA